MFNQTLGLAASDAISPSALDLAKAEDAVARLDERLATSPIAVAFRARTHVHDAGAAVFLEGELVHVDDLVLHDAAADIRSPTHALTRAHAALRAQRRIAAAIPGWAASAGLDQLRGLAPLDGAPEKRLQNTRIRSRPRKTRSPPSSPPSMRCWRGRTGF